MCFSAVCPVRSLAALSSIIALILTFPDPKSLPMSSSSLFSPHNYQESFCFYWVSLQGSIKHLYSIIAWITHITAYSNMFKCFKREIYCILKFNFKQSRLDVNVNVHVLQNFLTQGAIWISVLILHWNSFAKSKMFWVFNVFLWFSWYICKGVVGGFMHF